MRVYAAFVYLFLYGPIALIVVFSFNSGRYVGDMQGLSLQWYGKAFGNPFMMEALQNSVMIAATAATLATLFGTAAALVMQRMRGWFRLVFDGFTYVAIMVPGIVIGISTLIAMVISFDAVNGMLAALWPGEAPPSLAFGYGSVVAAHTLFTMALVIVIVRARITGMDRALIEASADLYATPWRTFYQVTLPQILPAVIAGFLLSFTFSFDDYVVASWVYGSTTTLPIYVFSSIRRGVTPEINAIGTAVLAVSLILLFGTQFLLRRGQNRARKGA